MMGTTTRYWGLLCEKGDHNNTGAKFNHPETHTTTSREPAAASSFSTTTRTDSDTQKSTKACVVVTQLAHRKCGGRVGDLLVRLGRSRMCVFVCRAGRLKKEEDYVSFFKTRFLAVPNSSFSVFI